MSNPYTTPWCNGDLIERPYVDGKPFVRDGMTIRWGQSSKWEKIEILSPLICSRCGYGQTERSMLLGLPHLEVPHRCLPLVIVLREMAKKGKKLP